MSYRVSCMASLAVGVLGVVGPAMAQPTINAIAPLPSQGGTRLFGLSNDGTVATGWSFPGFGSGTRGYRWTLAGGTVDLGMPANANGVLTYGISGDGSVIAGSISTNASVTNTARWTSSLGLQNLGGPSSGDSNALGVSGNGQVLIGNSSGGFRWTSGGGFQPVPAGINNGSGLFAVNGDGSIVGGYISPNFGANVATIWNGNTPVTIGGLPGDTRSDVRAMSADGSVLVGTSSTSSNSRAFRRIGNVMTQLGDDNAFFPAVSDDGTVIGGQNLGRASIWSSSLGLVDLNTYLPTLGLDLTGWNLREVTALSADGNVIGGDGSFNGSARGFVVTIPAPGAGVLLGLSGLLAARRRRA